MGISWDKNRIMETSSLARRLYGIKLIFKEGLTEKSKWFLLNREKLKYSVNLKKDGLVLDFGGYMGDFSANLLKVNPQLQCRVYEPVIEFAYSCQERFKNNSNVQVMASGVSSNGRSLKMFIDGPRTKSDLRVHLESFKTVSINSVFDLLEEVELVKMNIEGMEYECLRELEASGNLTKIKYLLVQFHNFTYHSEKEYRDIIDAIEKNHINIFKFKWLWELYRIKSVSAK